MSTTNVEIGNSTRVSLFFVVILLTSVIGCNNPFVMDCIEQDVKEVDSPDGKYVAKSSYRSCGATTSGMSSVTVRLVDQSESDAETAFSTKGKHSLFMIWESNTLLSIECLDCAPSERSRVKFQVARVSGHL